MRPGYPVAVIGAGLMGRWHADAARHSGGRVVAVVDPDPARAHALAASHPGARAETDLTVALDATRPAVAHVCTPLGTHVAVAEAAIERSLHVLVEKPFAADAAATSALLGRARARGVHALPTHQFCFQQGVLEALAWLRESGPPAQVELVAFSAGAEGKDGSARDGVVAEILPHPLALLARILPQEPASLAWHVEHPAPGEMRASASAGSVGVSVLISMSARPTRNSLRLAGANGTIHVDLFHGFAVREGGAVSRGRKILQPFAESGATLLGAAFNLAGRAIRSEAAYPGLRELVTRFYRAVQDGSAPPISPEETMAVALARDAILRRLGVT